MDKLVFWNVLLPVRLPEKFGVPARSAVRAAAELNTVATAQSALSAGMSRRISRGLEAISPTRGLTRVVRVLANGDCQLVHGGGRLLAWRRDWIVPSEASRQARPLPSAILASAVSVKPSPS
jgi:hypothetical protein